MQKQSYLSYRTEYCKIYLHPDFPVHMPAEIWSRSNDPITYMHFHNCMEIGYCFEGSGLFFIGDKVLPFSGGDACIIFRDEVHIAQSDAVDPGKWVFVYLDPEQLLSGLNLEDLRSVLELYEARRYNENVIRFNKYPEIAGLVKEIILELQRGGENYKSMVRANVWALSIKLSRLDSLRVPEEDTDKSNHLFKIAPALKFISENYMNPVSVKNLAEICNLSISHFRRLFVAAVNISPCEYVYTVRIKMASILLLNNEQSILEISSRVGYSTLSSFNRHFRRIMGTSPRDFKKCKKQGS